MEDLFNLSIKLEEREKVLANAEAEVGSGIRRVFLLEGEAEKRENRLVINIALRMVDTIALSRLATEVSSLLRASTRADEQIRAKNALEAAISNNEEDIDELENHLKVEIGEHELVIIGRKLIDIY